MSIMNELLRLKGQHKEGTKAHAALEWAVLEAADMELMAETFNIMSQEVDRAKED